MCFQFISPFKLFIVLAFMLFSCYKQHQFLHEISFLAFSSNWLSICFNETILLLKFFADDFFVDYCSRILANTLQHYMLCTFRKVLISAPTLLKSFREEGLWDLIFSDKFFYFGSSVSYIHQIIHEAWNDQLIDAPKSTDSKSFNETDVNILQAEAISFLEFAATLNENSNNLVLRIFSCLS